MGSEFKGFFAKANYFVEASDEKGASDGRMKRGEKQAVVTASGGAGDGSRSETTNAVGDEPFTLLGGGEVLANFRTKRDDGSVVRRRRELLFSSGAGFNRSLRSSKFAGRGHRQASFAGLFEQLGDQTGPARLM